MLRVFYGKDTNAVRTQAVSFIESYTREGFASVRIDEENYQSGILANSVEAVPLFSEAVVYVLDTPSGNEDFYSELISLRKELADSPHPFVVIEKNLLAPDIKKLSGFAECTKVEDVQKKDTFNIFSLTEVLLKKDKKNLWVQLNTAFIQGVTAEEIIGVLWWQLKMLKLAGICNSAEEARVKPFPYNKAKGALKNFTSQEVENLMLSLLTVYHDGHSGKVDIKLALEEWVLSF